MSFKCSVISVSNSKILYYGTKNTSIIFGMNAVIDFDLVKVKDDSGDPSDPDLTPREVPITVQLKLAILFFLMEQF